MNKLIQWAVGQIKDSRTSAKLLWASLPHQVQAGAVVFASVAGTTLAKELQALTFGNPHFTWITLRHDIAGAGVAGMIALRAFYMFPNRDVPEQVAIPTVSANPPAVGTVPGK
jgi:hypothetical protein